MTDAVPPDGFATGGALAASDPVRGAADLRLHATDEGAGVYRLALTVDGTEVSRQAVVDPDGTCVDVEPGNGDPHEFGAPQPCPLEADGRLQLDTATLRDGQHAIHATVEDAAGNESVVFDGSVETYNAPISTGAPVIAGDARAGAELTAAPGQWDGAPTGYDHRWLRCDADGLDCAPIAGASGPAYTLTDADAYHRMLVEVTAANGSGASTARSDPSALVADGTGRTAPPPPGGGDGSGGGGSGGTGGSGTGGGGSGTGGSGGTGGGAGAGGGSGGGAGGGSLTGGGIAPARLVAAFERADGRTVQRVSLRFGRRVAIVGRLVGASGAGIGDAPLGVAWRLPAHGGWSARAGTRTAPDGRFVYVLSPGPSRDVRFAFAGDARAHEASAVVHADVRAPLTIRADRKRVSGARVVGLSGRVGGGAIPRAGLLVTLQGWQRGWGWRTFRTVRTDRLGRWSTRYRFRLSAGRFGFRALVPHQAGFAYATSRSAGAFVVVG